MEIFEDRVQDAAFVPNTGQADAAEQILSWAKGSAPAIALTGAAGTGKTALLRFVAPLLIKHFDGPVLYTAMTGKAALRMRELLGVYATTFHGAFYMPPDPEKPEVEFELIRPPPEGSLLIVDEASMMTPKVWDQLRDSWLNRGVRVLLVGDPFQLPPVITRDQNLYGEDFSVFRFVQGPMLTEVMRSGDDVLWAATHIRETGALPRTSRGSFEITQVADAAGAAVKAFVDDSDDHALITWRNAYRMGASAAIRTRLGKATTWPERGEPLLIRKNGQQHLNGEIIPAGEFRPGPTVGGTIETMWMRLEAPITYVDSYGNERERVELLVYANMAGETPFIEDRDAWKSYKADLRRKQLPDPLPVTWGYALTSHVAQGSEFRRVTCFLAHRDVFNRAFKQPTLLPDRREIPFGARMLYTALTRAKTRASILIGKI